MSEVISTGPRTEIPATSRWARVGILLGIVAWSFGVTVGSLYSFQYELTPTETVAAADRWPAGSSCAFSTHHPTLVMFIHPRCPCTRASLKELDGLMTHWQGRLTAQAVFFQPPSAADDWARTDLWSLAALIPGLERRVDSDGDEQRNFAASVSGETFLYLPNGDLAFHGGITGKRGHAGDNPGRRALEELLQNHSLSPESAPVFGCELNSLRRASECREQGQTHD